MSNDNPQNDTMNLLNEFILLNENINSKGYTTIITSTRIDLKFNTTENEFSFSELGQYSTLLNRLIKLDMENVDIDKKGDFFLISIPFKNPILKEV